MESGIQNGESARLAIAEAIVLNKQNENDTNSEQKIANNRVDSEKEEPLVTTCTGNTKRCPRRESAGMRETMRTPLLVTKGMISWSYWIMMMP